MAHAHVSASSNARIGRIRGGGLQTADANEWLVKTGVGVKNMVYGRTFYRWPGQHVVAVDMKPRNISFNLHSISKDLVPFDIPVTFTIQPHDPLTDKEGFLRYAVRMNGLTEAEFHTILTGVIHGQTRILAGNLNVMDIFNGRDEFKTHVQEKVEKELIPYGLSVTNANISELRDMPGDDNRYFESLKQKAISGATNNARIEVAENKKKGDIGTKQREGEAMVETSRINADNVRERNARQQDIERSMNQLNIVKLECQEAEAIRQKEAQMAPLRKAAQLETELNRLNAEKELEGLRASMYSQSVVEAESAAKVAEGQAAAKRALADADLYASQKEAEGLLAKANAQADGLRNFLSIGDPELVKFYLGLERGLFTDIASEMANAVQGLNPKINIWNTGGSSENAADPMAPLRNLFTSLPPMLDAVQSQTGVKMPSWLPQQANEATSSASTMAAMKSNGPAAVAR